LPCFPFLPICYNVVLEPQYDLQIVRGEHIFKESVISMWEFEKREVIRAACSMSEKGLVSGAAGNVSMRLRDPCGHELLVITPSGKAYESLEVDDIVVIDFNGVRVEGELKASIEFPMHISIYQARKKISAIVHSHPVYCSVVAVMGNEIPSLIDEQVTYIGGEIKVAPYALPGSPELGANAVSALGPRNAVILANHGAIAVGRDLKEALTHSELMERTAQIYLYALNLGKVNPLPAEVVELEKAVFSSVFGENEIRD